MVLCLIAEPWDAQVGVPSLLELAPRVAVSSDGVAWVDARGLAVERLQRELVARLRSLGATRVRAGAAAQPVVAQLAAQQAEDGALRSIGASEVSAFLAPLPVRMLQPDAHTLALLEGVGIDTLGALRELPREAVEVRFGAKALACWRSARGEDERRLFLPVPPEAPHASLDFIDYAVTDPERLLFTANALLGTICDQLETSGAHARRLLLTLALGNGEKWERELKPARATASRATWLRLVRALLERLTVADAVVGMSLRVQSSEAASAVQGDLFDVGFASASAVEAAVARLLEEQGAVVVRPVASAHPLIEQRVVFEPVSLQQATSSAESASAPNVPGLTLQLLEQPKPVLVETVQRRDHEVPVRYRDGEWHTLVNAAGPDRVSGGQWDRSYAREYFRAVTTAGVLVWLFRDACRDRWYLHGWWD